MEQKFTTMAQEVIGDAIQSASAAGNAQVETLHVMDALLRQENGVIQRADSRPRAAARRTIGAAVRQCSGRAAERPAGPPPRSRRRAAS